MPFDAMPNTQANRLARLQSSTRNSRCRMCAGAHKGRCRRQQYRNAASRANGGRGELGSRYLRAAERGRYQAWSGAVWICSAGPRGSMWRSTERREVSRWTRCRATASMCFR